MICALTVRTLKPGTFDEFRQAFMGRVDVDDPPEGFVRFNMLRNADNPDEVICFGFFDGDADTLRRLSAEMDRDGQQQAIAPFVESVGTDGVFEVAEDFDTARTAS
jgi:heme-degrading monooxygenase HmoA